VKNGEIVLNVSYNATRNLQLGDDYVRFSARFNGVSREIIVPVGAVVSLFARETGEGMAWEPELGESGEAGEKTTTLRPVEVVSESEVAQEEMPPQDEPPTPTPPAGGRPHLRVVK
jgi:stringent starvation protein B